MADTDGDGLTDGAEVGTYGTNPLLKDTDAEPVVQVSTNHGATWTTVAHTSDYLTALDGHPLPDVDFGAPPTGQATFLLTEPRSNIDGLRLRGSEGGTASAGFLGVFELGVEVNRHQVGVTIVSVAKEGSQFRFEFDSLPGVTHVVQHQTSLTAANWQTLTTIAGDGTRKPVTDSVTDAHRFCRVANQSATCLSEDESVPSPHRILLRESGGRVHRKSVHYAG